jgi:hypothetical protein
VGFICFFSAPGKLLLPDRGINEAFRSSARHRPPTGFHDETFWLMPHCSRLPLMQAISPWE